MIDQGFTGGCRQGVSTVYSQLTCCSSWRPTAVKLPQPPATVCSCCVCVRCSAGILARLQAMSSDVSSPRVHLQSSSQRDIALHQFCFRPPVLSSRCPVRKGYSSISASTEQNQQSGGSAAKIIPARHTPLEQRESSELLEGRGCHSGRGPRLQSKAQV